MYASTDQATYQVRMHTWRWVIIDATLDNEVSTEIRQGDPHNVVDLGNSIRRAGWEQIPDWPSDADSLENWPPPEQRVTMTLTGAQWALVISALHRWAEVSEDLGDPDSDQDAADSRAIAALAHQQLTAQGWSMHGNSA